MKNTKALLENYVTRNILDRYAVCVGEIGKETVFITDGKTDVKTLFDMASVTKIIGVTLPFLLLFDKGQISLDDTLGDFFINCPEDKENITLKEIFTHTSGIKPIWFLSDITDNPEESVDIILNNPLGRKEFMYSCPGFILLGKIIEIIYDKTLDRILSEVTVPLFGLENTMYSPKENADIVNSQFTDAPHFVPSDKNAQFLGGVSGNAGIFSCISDMDRLCKILINGEKIFSEKTFLAAISNHTPDEMQSRGIGFLYTDEKYFQTGRLFSKGSFGHCGHSGTSMFIDRQNGIYVSVLTNMTRCVHDEYDKVKKFREEIHNAIYEDLKG